MRTVGATFLLTGADFPGNRAGTLLTHYNVLYASLTGSAPYVFSSRRTMKCPRAMSWKWPMNRVLMSPPATAPMMGTACAAAFSVTTMPL